MIKTKYETTNGTQFDTYEEAVDHEKIMVLRHKVTNKFYPDISEEKCIEIAIWMYYSIMKNYQEN